MFWDFSRIFRDFCVFVWSPKHPRTELEDEMQNADLICKAGRDLILFRDAVSFSFRDAVSFPFRTQTSFL